MQLEHLDFQTEGLCRFHKFQKQKLKILVIPPLQVILQTQKERNAMSSYMKIIWINTYPNFLKEN